MQLSVHGISQKYGLWLANFSGNDDDADMIAYGMEVFLGSLLKMTVLFTLAIILGTPYEAAVILLVSGSLRTLSGGVHCTAYYRCMVTGTIVMLALGILVKACLSLFLNHSALILILLLSSALYLYWQYSPQAPNNKPISDKTTERKIRLLTVSLALIYALVAVYFGTGSRTSWSIATGMLWQAITLTGPGYKLISFFDNLLIL